MEPNGCTRPSRTVQGLVGPYNLAVIVAAPALSGDGEEHLVGKRRKRLIGLETRQRRLCLENFRVGGSTPLPGHKRFQSFTQPALVRAFRMWQKPGVHPTRRATEMIQF